MTGTVARTGSGRPVSCWRSVDWSVVGCVWCGAGDRAASHHRAASREFRGVNTRTVIAMAVYCTARHIPPYRFVAYTVIYRGIGRTLRASAVGFTAKAEAAVDAARCRPPPCGSQQDSSQKATEVGCLSRLYKYFIMRNHSAEPVNEDGCLGCLRFRSSLCETKAPNP